MYFLRHKGRRWVSRGWRNIADFVFRSSFLTITSSKYLWFLGGGSVAGAGGSPFRFSSSIP